MMFQMVMTGNKNNPRRTANFRVIFAAELR